MKTKGFGKLIALVLCMAMAFSMSSTAFAAEPTANVEAGNGAAIISVDNTQAGASVAAEIPVFHYPLKAHEGIKLSLGTLTAGQTVTVIVGWKYSEDDISTTPVLHIGLPVSTATSFEAIELESKEPLVVEFKVNTTAPYSLFLANPSSYQLDVNFSVLVSG